MLGVSTSEIDFWVQQGQPKRRKKEKKPRRVLNVTPAVHVSKHKLALRLPEGALVLSRAVPK
jgi:hypothetical protein